jgi:hypothetical protein
MDQKNKWLTTGGFMRGHTTHTEQNCRGAVPTLIQNN